LHAVRVTALNYTLDLRDGLTYAKEARLEAPLDGFQASLAADACRFSATDDFVSENPADAETQARAKLEPQLNAWRCWVLAERGQDWLPFAFRSADVEPWPRASTSDGVATGRSLVRFSARGVGANVSTEFFPVLPPHFVADDVVLAGHSLYVDALRLPRHALKFAFAYLSIIETHYKGRSNAERALGLGKGVLGDLGMLCTYGAEGLEARKMDAGSPRITFTDERRAWVHKMFSALMRGHGVAASGHQPENLLSERCPGLQQYREAGRSASRRRSNEVGTEGQ
jgi:hypothetical protein